MTPTAFADDLTLRQANKDPHAAANNMQLALDATEDWCRVNYMTIAPDKTEALLVSLDPAQNKAKLKPRQTLCGVQVAYKESIKVLGVTIDHQVTMAHHAREAAATLRKRTRMLSLVAAKSWGADSQALRDLYCGYVRPAAAYAAGTWFPHLAPTNADRLESANYSAARVVTVAAAGSNRVATCR